MADSGIDSKVLNYNCKHDCNLTYVLQWLTVTAYFWLPIWLIVTLTVAMTIFMTLTWNTTGNLAVSDYDY